VARSQLDGVLHTGRHQQREEWAHGGWELVPFRRTRANDCPVFQFARQISGMGYIMRPRFICSFCRQHCMHLGLVGILRPFRRRNSPDGMQLRFLLLHRSICMQCDLSSRHGQSSHRLAVHPHPSWQLFCVWRIHSMPQRHLFYCIRRLSLHRLCSRHIQRRHWRELGGRLPALHPGHLHLDRWIRCLRELQPGQVQHNHWEHCMHSLSSRKAHRRLWSNERLCLVLERNQFCHRHRINRLHCLHSLLPSRSKNPNRLHTHIQHHL
jgi:hypothetical protein